MKNYKQEYAAKLRDPRWQKVRLTIFERDGWSCCCCGATTQTLQVHHTAYRGREPWDTPLELLETCCDQCHPCAQVIAYLIMDVDGIDGIKLADMRNAGRRISKQLREKMASDDPRGGRSWNAYYCLMRESILEDRKNASKT